MFAVFGFADMMGHKCRRGELYSERLRPYMTELKKTIDLYKEKNPEEEVLIVSDHGMSTVRKKINPELTKYFGKQGDKTYIAYCDTAVMCVWTKDKNLEEKIAEHLSSIEEGHLLTEEERAYFGAADKKFGDLIYILREGNVFADNWFGKSVKKPNPDGSGMHGFWPEREAKDQMACIILSGKRRKLNDLYDYKAANKLITEVMKGGE
ncbi:MAG: alkaline phosphatase family protein [Clostridia bacterium]|nr:alkaline phosphatase family protein [Clostridia bacterium]